MMDNPWISQITRLVVSLFWIVCLLSLRHGQVWAVFTTITTSGGIEYLISDYTVSGSSATTECSNQGLQLGFFTSNAEYQDLIDYLQSSGSYNSMDMWVSLTKEGNAYHFLHGEEVANDKWSPGEPNQSCESDCCYNAGYSHSQGVFALENSKCFKSKNIICRMTSTLIVTTFVSTTAPPTANTKTSAQNTLLTTTITSTTTTTTLPSLALSTGEQMTILYLAVIVAGSLTISCLCAGGWLFVNRHRKRKGLTEEDKENIEKQLENRFYNKDLDLEEECDVSISHL